MQHTVAQLERYLYYLVLGSQVLRKDQEVMTLGATNAGAGGYQAPHS
jgi:hypothetical protein